jgi:hypothetical protein
VLLAGCYVWTLYLCYACRIPCRKVSLLRVDGTQALAVRAQQQAAAAALFASVSQHSTCSAQSIMMLNGSNSVGQQVIPADDKVREIVPHPQHYLHLFFSTRPALVLYEHWHCRLHYVMNGYHVRSSKSTCVAAAALLVNPQVPSFSPLGKPSVHRTPTSRLS